MPRFAGPPTPKDWSIAEGQTALRPITEFLMQPPKKNAVVQPTAHGRNQKTKKKCLETGEGGCNTANLQGMAKAVQS